MIDDAAVAPTAWEIDEYSADFYSDSVFFSGESFSFNVSFAARIRGMLN